MLLTWTQQSHTDKTTVWVCNIGYVTVKQDRVVWGLWLQRNIPLMAPSLAHAKQALEDIAANDDAVWVERELTQANIGTCIWCTATQVVGTPQHEATNNVLCLRCQRKHSRALNNLMEA